MKNPGVKPGVFLCSQQGETGYGREGALGYEWYAAGAGMRRSGVYQDVRHDWFRFTRLPKLRP